MPTSLALNVRRKRPGDVRSFIPVEPEPAQIFADRVREFFAATIAIQVFDPQHQLTTRFARALLCMPERHGMTDVQEAGWRRCNSAAICSLCHSERSRRISNSN